MSKPDWKDAPQWALYLAQDQSGTWYWYSRKPDQGDSYWIASGGVSERALSPLVDKWEETLEERP